MSVSVFDLSVPATVNVLSLNSMSSTEASIRWAAIFLPLAMILSIALHHRRAANREAAAAIGAHAERDLRGVAVHDVDLIERHAELLAPPVAPASFRGPGRGCACRYRP